jgi:predicted acetyltransferase
VIELVRPTTDLAASWWELVDAFEGETVHGSGYRHTDRARLAEPAVFALWVDWLGRMERTDLALPEGRVASSYRWVVEDGRVVGTVALRHALTPALLVEGGHIGYAVAPFARRRGIATAALRLALAMAAARGIDPVLVTCDDDNVGSARTVESCGGYLEQTVDGHRRYWVATGAPADPIGPDPLETRWARLVPVTREDADAMRRGERRPTWAPGYPRQDDLDAVGMLDRPDAWSPRHVVRRSDGLTVGTIGCFGPPVDGVVEVGYGLVPEARGGGLMTDVLGTMCRALDAAGLAVVARTAPDNAASHRVLARLGFRRTPADGTAADAEWLWTRPRNGVVTDA